MLYSEGRKVSACDEVVEAAREMMCNVSVHPEEGQQSAAQANLTSQAEVSRLVALIQTEAQRLQAHNNSRQISLQNRSDTLCARYGIS